MPGQLRRCVVLVGGAGGIGRSAAGLFRLGGWDILLADRDPAKLVDAVASLPPGPGSVSTLVLDMNDGEAVRRASEGMKSDGLRMRALVIVAAVHGTWPAELLPDSEIDRVMSTNLTSHMRLVRDLLPLLGEGSRLVGVSSIAASVGVPMSSLYSASKAGMEAFYECLATELSHRGIRVSVVRPGNVDTGFNETGNGFPGCGDPAVDLAYARVVSGIDSSLGMPPRRVADAVYRAATSRSPRFLYVVGMNALKAHWAVRILGKGLAVQLMARFFGLDGPGASRPGQGGSR